MRTAAFTAIVLGYFVVFGAAFEALPPAARFGAILVIAGAVTLAFISKPTNRFARNILLLAVAGGAILLAGIHLGEPPDIFAFIGGGLALPGAIWFGGNFRVRKVSKLLSE